MKSIKRWILLLVVLMILIGAGWWIVWGNTALTVSEYTITEEELPEAFSGFRIAQISDLHNAVFGENNEELIAMLADTHPDMIVITGDLVDATRPDLEVGLAFARAAQEIAPTYYVTGNHEAGLAARRDLLSGLEACGVMVLKNKRIEITRDNESLLLIGLQDANFMTGEPEEAAREVLTKLMGKDDDYTVLLSHRPELYDVYVSFGMDLVFSGHAHGGQFRLPFVGGLYAPGQGWLPRYDGGLFMEDDTTMVVSRGLGNSRFPFRVNNRPEIVVVELKKG